MEVRTGACLCGEPEKVVDDNGKQVLVRCPLWINLPLREKDPQGKTIDHWGCSIGWTPILLIENADRMRYVEGEIEALRKESVERGDQELTGLLTIAENIERLHDEMVRGQQIILKMNGSMKEVSDARDNHS